VVVLAAKFTQGAWITVLLIPGLLVLMGVVRRHYHSVLQEIRSPQALELSNLAPLLVVVPVQHWNQTVKKSLRFALTISSEVRAVHVDLEEGPDGIGQEWNRLVEQPAHAAGMATPELVVLPSPYRTILAPIVNYVIDVERASPDRQIAVLIPELVERHWYHHLLHNKRAAVLKALLLVKGNRRITVINVPWYLKS
jgi:hypothetical protein